MNPFTVAIIAGSLAFIASAIGVYLCIYTCLYPEDNDKKDNYILELDTPDKFEKPKKNTIFTGEDCD